VHSRKLMLALARTVVLGSEPHGTHEPILLPDCSGNPRAATGGAQTRRPADSLFDTIRTVCKATRPTVILFLLVFISTGTCSRTVA
jgi:hypothetical protein